MSDIYEMHRKAFNRVSALIVLDSANERFATVAFEFPEHGAGRLYCYFHLIGVQMVRAYASGYGYSYDKRSAAVSSAAKMIPEPDPTTDATRKAELMTHRLNMQNVLKDRGTD